MVKPKRKKAKLEMQYLCIDQTTPRSHEGISMNSSVRIEFPPLVELAQKLCVLEDFDITIPTQYCNMATTNTVAFHSSIAFIGYQKKKNGFTEQYMPAQP